MSINSEDSPFTPKRKLERSPSNKVSPPTKMGQCKLCNKSLRSELSIYCGICKNGFHNDCIGHTNKYLESLSKLNCEYVCPSCNRDEVATKSFFKHSMDELLEKINVRFDQKFDEIKVSIDNAVQPIKEHINKIDTILDANTKRIEDLEKSVKDIDKNSGKESVSQLKREIIYLKSQITQSSVVVSGVPEEKDEDLHHIIKNIGASLMTKIESFNIKKVYRMKKNADVNKPTNIVVEFVHDELRDRLLQNFVSKVKKKESLKCSDAGINSDGKININRHIPKEIMTLYMTCRKLKDQGLIQHTLAKPTHVLIKKNDKWYTMQETGDLVKLGIKN